MQDNKRNFAEVDREPTPNHDGAPRRVQLSANMTRRLEYLAPWRMDPSLIKFSKLAPKFGGGCAVVSQALLFSPSDDAKDQLLELKTGGLTTSNRAFESEVANDREAEGSQEEERRNESVTEEQDHECNDGTSVGRKPIAVKKMKVKTKSDVLKVLGLTIREAEFLVSHSHDNIIKLEGFVEDLSKNVFWLILPWEENGTLKEFIASTECEIPERISLLHDVTKALEYLHSRNPPICHGDLKSGNILVNSKCRAVLTDFGSAHHLTTKSPNKQLQTKTARFAPQPAGSSEESFYLSTNTITLTCNKYTLRWAAPELLWQDDASLASDVWAFGCVAYEAITKLIPFQDVKDDMVVTRIVRGDLPNISGDAGMELIQALCTLVGECWNINPSKRPTAEQCRGAIKWMPMVIPNRVRSAATTNLAGRSAEVLMQLGYMHQRQSDYSNALKCFAGALRLFGDVADRNGKANAFLGLAEVNRLQNEYSQATTLYFECLQIHTDIGNRLGRADALIGLAHVHRVHHEYCQAVTILSECLQILTDVGDRRERADALFCLADVHRVRSEYSQAVTFYSECLQIRTDIGDRRGRAEALWGLAEVHRLRNEYGQAATLLSECIQIRTDIGDRQGRAEALIGLAEVYQFRNEYDQAFTLFSECLQIRSDIGDRQGRAEALIGLAEVYQFRNEYNQATTLYSECLQIRTMNGDRPGRAEALWGLAEVYRLQNECEKAVALFYESIRMRTDVGDRQGRAEALGVSLKCIRLATSTTRPSRSTPNARKSGPTSVTDLGEPPLILVSLTQIGF